MRTNSGLRIKFQNTEVGDHSVSKLVICGFQDDLSPAVVNLFEWRYILYSFFFSLLLHVNTVHPIYIDLRGMDSKINFEMVAIKKKNKQ